MPPVKSKKIDTSTTNPAEFLAGNVPPPDKPIPPEPSPETPIPPASGVAADPPGSSVPVISVAPAIPPTPQPAPAAPPPQTPNRPGLEAPAAPVVIVPDPFVLVASWNSESSRSTLRAFPVPGGCLVRCVQQYTNGVLLQNVCFVPGVTIHENRLIDSNQVPPKAA